MASGLFSAAFHALSGGSISLTGTPGPPTLGGFSTSRAAITSLWPRWHEPAFAIFKQAPATARMPTATVASLTRRQRGHTQVGPREGKLPSGQAAGRWYFPPPLCADDMDAARPGSGVRHMPAYSQRFTRARGCRGMQLKANAAIDGSRNGSTGSAIMVQFLAAANTEGFETRK